MSALEQETDECRRGFHLGTQEAALILGVERSRLAKWLTENENGKESIEEPVDRLGCGPIWTRAQIDRKLRALFLAEGCPNPGDLEAEAAFQAWARERQLARAKREGVSPTRLEEIVSGQLPVAA